MIIILHPANPQFNENYKGSDTKGKDKTTILQGTNISSLLPLVAEPNSRNVGPSNKTKANNPTDLDFDFLPSSSILDSRDDTDLDFDFLNAVPSRSILDSRRNYFFCG